MQFCRAYKSFVIWLSLSCQIAAQTTAWAQPHLEGAASGQAANAATRNQITTPVAREVVPGYTTTPPESAYFGRPNLIDLAGQQLAACALTPQDPVCQAQLGAASSANTPREPVSANDATVLAARRIAANPAATLQDIASYYSGCRVDPIGRPAAETRICHQGIATTEQSCTRTLGVSVTRTPSCSVGTWYEHAVSGTTGLDVQCIPDQSASRQRFRVTSAGVPQAFFDVDMTQPIAFPRQAASLPDSGSDPSNGPNAVWVVDNQCQADNCRLTALVANEYRSVCTGGFGPEAPQRICTTVRPFLPLYSPCAAGTLGGNLIVNVTGSRDEGYTSTYLDEQTCFAPSATLTTFAGRDIHGDVDAAYWTPSAQRVAIGWAINPAYGPVPRMTLPYVRAVNSVTESDLWDDRCARQADGIRCNATAAPQCVDGPGTKEIDGVPVTRACWKFETPLSCSTGALVDDCTPLQAAGCTASGSVCRQANPGTGICELSETSYSCPVAPSNGVAVSNCPANVFCVAGSCFDTSYTKDSDFARSMSFLEAAREAGIYLDTDNLQVFKGEANSCRDRLFKDCCDANAAGKGMSNQSLLGAGSRLVYDVLMNAGNREFLYQGMSALLSSGGFSGSFTSYGVTVAVNGTALPAGSAVLFSGQSVVVAFDPWSLAIAVVIYAITSLTTCNQGEAKLAMKEGASLCHTIGSYCSSCIRVLGRCVSCIEHTTGKCCFNSVLARVINEQGRIQVAKNWGSAQGPNCSGFSIAQLQALDFSKMDLSEFYASIVPKLPDDNAIAGANTARAANCYYGKGKCQ